MTRAPSAITTIIILTADRPGLLGRTLQSFIGQCDRHLRQPRCLVVDGSRAPSSQTATHAAVTAAARAGGPTVGYVGTAESSAFLARLRQRGAPALESIPDSVGASRSLGLLLTAGENVLCADDDILCDTWALPEAHQSLVVMGHDELRHVAFFPDRHAALASLHPVSADLIGAHDALLSRSLPELVERGPARPDLTRACEHVWARLREGRPLVVKLTFAGLAGDSGTSTPRRLLLSSGSFRDRLWSAEREFETAMTCREVVRIARSNLVTHRSHCLAGCMGVSSGSVVPPFPSINRGEDGVFGVLLAAADPGALFGHIPVGIVHDSPRGSSYDDVWIQAAAQVRQAELLVAWIVQAASALTGGEPPERLQQIGVAMTGIAGLGRRAFVTNVERAIRETRLEQLDRAEQASTGCPSFWRRALDDHRAACLRAMTRPEFFLPVEYHSAGSLEAGFTSLQTFIGDFGARLTAWPALWEAARAENPLRRTP